MRKSAFPSQRGNPPPPSRAAGAADSETPHRVSILPELYPKGDASVGGLKVASSTETLHRDFRHPAQDPTKVQFFDPDRARKSLGGKKIPQYSSTGTRTLVYRVRAGYPDQLDYRGIR